MLICYTIIGSSVYITLLLGEMATQYSVAGPFLSPHPSLLIDHRLLQRVHNQLLLPVMRLRPLLELFLQRCRVPRLRSRCRTTRPPVLDFLEPLGLQSPCLAHPRLHALPLIPLLLSPPLRILARFPQGCHYHRLHHPQHCGQPRRKHSIPTSAVTNGRFPGHPLLKVSLALQTSWSPQALHARPFVFSPPLTHPLAVARIESLGIIAGKTRNPSQNMPKVVKFVFWA